MIFPLKGLSSRFGITVLLLSASLVASKLSERRTPDVLAQPLETIETRISGWTVGDAKPMSSDVLTVLKPTSYLSRTYRRSGKQLGLFIAFYAQQRAGESMHSPKNCLPGSGWEVWNYGTVDVPVNGQRVLVNKYSVQNGSERILVLYWYQSKRRIIASEYFGKICLVRDAITFGHTSGSIVRITLPDRPGALEDAVGFAALLIPQMQNCLGR